MRVPKWWCRLFHRRRFWTMKSAGGSVHGRGMIQAMWFKHWCCRCKAEQGTVKKWETVKNWIKVKRC